MARTDVGLGPFTADPLTITDGCLNARHRGIACRRCVDACPVDAIVLGAGMPVLDSSVCLRCGACIPTCPTEAIHPRAAERSLHFAVADAPREAAVTLACPRGGTATVAMPVIRHDRCLAALGADELLDLAGDPARDLWLDDSPCATCELGQLHDAIDQAAARANGLRAAFGLDPIVHRTTTESSTTPVDEPRPRVVDARHGAMSRRGLFRRLLGDVGARGGAPAAEAAVPPRRQRLLQRLRTWATEPKPSADAPVTSSLGFGDVRIDTDRCSACGLCATFCPTSALTLDITSRDPDLGTFTLSVRPASCLDCGLCSVACPSDAITVTPRIAAGAVTAGSSKTVATGRRIACEVCGTATAALTDGNGRCFSCLEGVVTPLRDEKGLMADLLGRIPQP